MSLQRRRSNNENGVALIPMILALSFVILVVTLALGVMSFSETNIGAAQQKADEAFFVSQGGVTDAMIKIARNKNYSSAGYNITIGNGTAAVVVQKDVPAAGQSRISSTGTVGNSKRKIQTDVNVSSGGKVTIASWIEMAP